MILGELSAGSSDFLHMERFVNIGSPSGFTDLHTTSPQTCPRGDCESFYLCSIEAPDSITIEEYGAQPTFCTQWQMLVHPDQIGEREFDVCTKIDRHAVRVAPTSSSRTVKMLDREGWFLKLSYKGLIGRVDRQLSRVHAISATEVSRAIADAIDQTSLPNNFGILREVYGRVLVFSSATSPNSEWGFVAREPMPYGPLERAAILIPAFSLFSPDLKSPDDPTLLIQLIEKQDRNPEDFLFDDLISPLHDAYFSLLIHFGLQLEAHAQNMLYALDDQLDIIGVVARDAESIDKDFSLMDELGLSKPYTDTKYKRLLRSDYNYQIMHSFMFDFKMGEYLTKPIIRHAGERFSFDQELLEERIRSHNAKYTRQLPADFFPRNWYSYENIVHDRTRRRPYITHESPRYR